MHGFARYYLRRALFASVALAPLMFLGACSDPNANTDPDTATGVGDLSTPDQQSAVIQTQVSAEIARAAAQAASSLQVLQEEQAPISTPVESNVLTPSTQNRFASSAPGLAVGGVASSSSNTSLPPSADPNPDDAYVPPPGAVVSVPAVVAPTPIPVASVSHMNVANLPADLAQPITIKWSGTVKGALQDLAERIGYTFNQTGTDTGSHPEIALNEVNDPAADVLQDIGYQVQHYGHVDVNPSVKTITLNLY